MMKPLSEHYVIELIEQAKDALLRDDKHMVACCLDVAGRRALHFEAATAMWRGRAIREARTRMRLAKEKKLLRVFNRRLLKKIYSWQVDDEGIRISYGALYADENMIRMSLEEERDELLAAIQRLPEPPPVFGDGPDERVGWVLRECKMLKEAMERNLRAAQLAESKLEETTKVGEELIDERDEIILHLTVDLAHVRTLQERIFTWGMETFGPGQRQEGVYAHLAREIKELGECLGTLGAAEELADCTILLFELAGFHSADLITEVEGKFAVNKTRKWGPIEEDGSILHIKEEWVLDEDQQPQLVQKPKRE